MTLAELHTEHSRIRMRMDDLMYGIQQAQAEYNALNSRLPAMGEKIREAEAAAAEEAARAAAEAAEKACEEEEAAVTTTGQGLGQDIDLSPLHPTMPTNGEGEVALTIPE